MGLIKDAIGGTVGGLTSIASGIIGSRKRKREERAAKAEFDAAKQRMAGFDTSNLYANMENAYEDLTVNQQAAQFQAEQNQASQANIMSSMAGAAGGGGIAALAQTMANQSAEIAGAESARQMDLDKQSFLFDQSSQRLGAAKAARAQATEAIYGGIGQMGNAAGAAGEAILTGGLG